MLVKKYSSENERKDVRFVINSSYWLTYDYLLKACFRVRGALLRLIKFSEDIKSFDHHNE